MSRHHDPRPFLSFCTVVKDGVPQPKPGEIARLLHMDMTAHRKKTQDFNDGWKVNENSRKPVIVVPPARAYRVLFVCLMFSMFLVQSGEVHGTSDLGISTIARTFHSRLSSGMAPSRRKVTDRDFILSAVPSSPTASSLSRFRWAGAREPSQGCREGERGRFGLDGASPHVGQRWPYRWLGNSS